MSASASGSDLPDDELIRRAVAGDREAFGAIYRRYQAIVYRFARMMSGSAAAAEDVTQEVFVVLMRDLWRYESERAALATYLYAMTRNLTRGRLRRERRFVSLEAATPGSRRCSASESDPSIALVQAQDVARVRRAILALPSRYREALILCDLHGLSYADAALVLGSPVGTVRSRLHRARRLVADRLRGLDEAGVQALARARTGCVA